MDKSKLIVSGKYRTTHGCKFFTSNDDLNIPVDEICEVTDISIEGDNGQELHERKTVGNSKRHQFEVVSYITLDTLIIL